MGTSIPRNVQALVDSGANLSILHPQLAQYLGFDLKKLGSPKAGGVSASGVYIRSQNIVDYQSTDECERANTYFRVLEYLLAHVNLKNNTEGFQPLEVYKSWILPNSIDVNIYGYNFSFNFTVIDSPNQIWGCILGEDSIFSVARIDFQKFKNFF